MMCPNHLYLTGYRGCGKSTVAEFLSSHLKMPFVDTDHLVESTANKSIKEIFEQDGEAAFRDLEAAVVRNLASGSDPMIIALGGGAILRDSNRNWIQDTGWVAWLKASPETLAQRIAGDASTAARRPSLSQLGVLEEVRSILSKREPLYNLISHDEFDTEVYPLPELAVKIAESYVRWCQLNSR